MMNVIENGAYRARPTQNETDIAKVQALRARTFGLDSALDADDLDSRFSHVLVESCADGQILGGFRYLELDGSEVAACYSAKYYDLSGLKDYPGPLMELGRFCTSPDHQGPDIVRMLWAAVTDFVDRRDVKLLFGCTSFPGTNATLYRHVFGRLHARYLAPVQWRPGRKAPEIIPFEKVENASSQDEPALRHAPALLRSYLTMGGWVSDHAVVDRDLRTLHVFTGVEVSAIPHQRKQILRGSLPK